MKASLDIYIKTGDLLKTTNTIMEQVFEKVVLCRYLTLHRQNDRLL